MNHEEQANKITERMNTQLSLSEEQLTQVKDINHSYALQRKDLISQNQGNREAIKEEMKKSRKEQNGKLKTILTKEQYQELKKIKKEMKPEKGEFRQR